MMKITKLSLVLCISILPLTFMGGSFATEEIKDPNAHKTTATTTPSKPETTAKETDKIEPLGLESGKLVDVPANAAHKLGEKINELLGNDDK